MCVVTLGAVELVLELALALAVSFVFWLPDDIADNRYDYGHRNCYGSHDRIIPEAAI